MPGVFYCLLLEGAFHAHNASTHHLAAFRPDLADLQIIGQDQDVGIASGRDPPFILQAEKLRHVTRKRQKRLLQRQVLPADQLL